MNNLNPLQNLVIEMVENQKKVVFACAKRILPNVSPDDLLQPNDFPELENHPHFRYEEGVLAGMQSIEIGLRALAKDMEHCF